MDWSTRITIWFFVTTVADCVVIQRPQTLIWMLMCPDDYINTVVIQQFLQTKPASSNTRIAMWTALVLHTRYATQLYCNITGHLCVLDRASSWYLNKGKPTRWHLLYYVNLLLNMFQMLIHPSSGAFDYLLRFCVGCIVLTWGVLVLCSGIGCWWCGIRV